MNCSGTKELRILVPEPEFFQNSFYNPDTPVIGIEPNDHMRRAAETRLGKYHGFTSRNHRAEQTGLRSHSLDMITVAQAFHWMEPIQDKKRIPSHS